MKRMFNSNGWGYGPQESTLCDVRFTCSWKLQSWIVLLASVPGGGDGFQSAGGTAGGTLGLQASKASYGSDGLGANPSPSA